MVDECLRGWGGYREGKERKRRRGREGEEDKGRKRREGKERKGRGRVEEQRAGERQDEEWKNRQTRQFARVQAGHDFFCPVRHDNNNIYGI